MRVLHLPSAVGGNAWNLSHAERKIGIDSQVYYSVNSPYFKQMEADILVRNKKLWKNGKTSIIAAWLFYRRNIKKFDIFHFNFGQTLLVYPNNEKFDFADLKYLKKKKKIIVVTYQGSDSRQAEYCLKNQDITYFREFSEDDIKTKIEKDKKKIKRIEKFSEYADLIYYTNPDLGFVLPQRAKFRPYTKIDISSIEPSYSDYTKNEIVIAHAPTNRIIKGTKYILDAIERLKEEKFKIKLDLIENMSNEEALDHYKNADLVVDQILAGWYGGLAVECMAMGKPVISYLRTSDFDCLNPKMREEIPVINANPDTIYEVLKHICNNPESLATIALKSRKFVEKYHDCIEIAKIIKEDYQQVFKEYI